MTLPPPADWPVANPIGEPSGDVLGQRTVSTPDRTAVVDADSGERWTFGEFDDRVSRRVERLERWADVVDGRVGVLLGTRVPFADLYFATERRAAAVAPLNVDLPTDVLGSQAERAELDCIVCCGETEDRATEVAPGDVPVASVDQPRRDDVDSLEPRHDAVAYAFERPLASDRVVMFTSGTTGTPKGVRLTRRNLVASAVGSAYRLGVDPDDRWLVCLPMYHMGGLAPLVRSTLYGTTTVIQRSFDAESTADVIDEYDVTGVSLVPTMLARLLDAGWRPPDSLRFVLLGGAPAPPKLIERSLDAGLPVYPTYGLTETASQVATATPADVETEPETVGRPLRGTDVSILGGDGTPADVGDTGEIAVSGPTVTPGYLDDEQTTAAFGPEGLHTGDVGYRDDDGRLWVVGRVDDRIVTGGENVQPATVIDALRAHPDVKDAAVVGLPDREWGERVAALVVAERDELTTHDVLAHARDELASFAVPKTLGFASSLPRTASGTVDRAVVRERLEAVSTGRSTDRE